MMKRILVSIVFVCLAGACSMVLASSEVVTAKVSIAAQTMRVYVGDDLKYSWLVSTAGRGHQTPLGSFAPYALDKDHVSSIYKDAMPYTVFFKGNYAIHGTTEPEALGRPVSHGCVRLLTANARTFYELVVRHGMRHTKIVIEP